MGLCEHAIQANVFCALFASLKEAEKILIDKSMAYM